MNILKILAAFFSKNSRNQMWHMNLTSIVLILAEDL